MKKREKIGNILENCGSWIFGALFLIILLWAVSVQLVWEIRIDGLETLTREEVIQGLEKQGVAVGKSYRGLDLWQVQNEYLIADARLEWIKIGRAHV